MSEKQVVARRSAALKTSGHLARAGHQRFDGAAVLNSLHEGVVSISNVRRYAQIVVDRSKARALHDIGARATELAMDETVPVDQRAERLAAELATLMQATSTRDPVRLGDSIREHIGVIEARYEGRVRVTATGLAALDRYMGGGFRPGNLVIVAARPSMGKTAMALTIGVHMAKSVGVGFVSLEMSREELNDRALALLGAGDLAHLQQPDQASADFWGRLTDAAHAANSPRLYIDDQSGLSLAQLALKARNLKRTRNIDVLIVDYLQLMSGRDDKVNRAYQLEEICRGLKSLAKELNIVVIALAQVNRRVGDAMPGLSDLKDSGSIEQDADVVAFVHRPIQHDPSLGTQFEHFAKLFIAKNRQGRTGVVPLAYIGHETRFGSWDGPEPQESRRPAGRDL